MVNKEIQDKYKGKWVLLNNKNEVVYFSDKVADVVKKGREYPISQVSIEKKFEHGTCFF